MKTDWEKIAFVRASKSRGKILDALSEPKTPTEIAKVTGQSTSNISRALQELQKKKIVKCLTPNLRKGRLYIKVK